MRACGRQDPEREVVPRLVREQELADPLEDRRGVGQVLDFHRAERSDVLPGLVGCGP